MKNFVKTVASQSRRSQNPQVLLTTPDAHHADRKNRPVANAEGAIQEKWRTLLDKAIEKESIPESLNERIDALLSK